MSPESDRINEASMRSIEDSVVTLTGAIQTVSVIQSRQIVRLRRTLHLVVIGLALDMALTLGGVYVYTKVHANGARINAVQCSLYDLFLDSYDPHSANARENPDAYDKSFSSLERDAKRLDCPHQTRGKD